jgi:hypothetical protein
MVPLPVDSLFRIAAFTVRDIFGVTSTLTRFHNLDGPRWSVFDLAGDRLFLPPTLAQNLSGAANLTWGI